jgi:lipooligosaccharide transport system permease protein
VTSAFKVLEHHLFVYRRTWRGGLFTTFLAPVLFLLAMGLGLGTFVDAADTAALGGVSYLAFLAPGLLAAQAMQTAVGESTYPIMAGIVWLRTFHAMVATPLRALDVVLGQTLWFAVRLSLVAVAFVVVMILFGAVDPVRGLALLPVAILTGLAFATPISAWAATRRTDSSFPVINRFIVVPLFIFSGTFFPLDQLPAFLHPIAWATPLWNGVALARSIALASVSLPMVAFHILVLMAWIVAGVLWGVRTYQRRLVQ